MVPLHPLALRHEIGDVIKERYAIRDVLGAGAFGTVYRVEETLGSRTVAMACKEMHVLDDPETSLNERAEALRMFQEEAYLLQTLRHPHIPAAYFESAKAVWLACPVCGRTFKGSRECPDHGAALQVVNERYYLLMDFIEGPDLENMLEENGGRPLDEVTVIDYTLQVCTALETVHGKGFSHRDIKPANIKIQKKSGEQGIGHGMLIDFGLVKPSMTAGRYGTVLKRGSTAMGTFGYAPVSPDEQNSPDARTDILALGMTIYRVLSGRDPTEPADLEQMRAKKPRDFNSQLSPLIETIILKAIQLDREKRYADVASLRADLQAARYPVETVCPHCGFVQRSLHAPDAQSRCERCGRSMAPQLHNAPATPGAAQRSATPTKLSPPSPSARTYHQPNPYLPRIGEIQRVLQQPPATPQSTLDARIAEIDSALARTSKFTVGPLHECPSCRQSTLSAVSGQPTGQCPLCAQAQLVRRQLELTNCPVCREGTLHEHQLPEHELFCPICRAVPLQVEERRALLGLAIDAWWKCPNCSSAWDVTNKGNAILETVGDDPFGIGQERRGDTLPIFAWRTLSGREDKYLQCDRCSAQWDILDGDALRLAFVAADPFAVGQSHLGSTLARSDWARLAQNLPRDAGSHFCPHCHAEWDYDRNQQAMTLKREGSVLPQWAARWRGTAVSLPAWYFASQGKTSFHPGRVCPRCHSEWDDDNQAWKLVASSNAALKPSIGQSYTSEDWRRLAMGLPSVAEVSRLSAELKRLREQRGQEQSGAQRKEERRRGALEDEEKELYKRAILEGYTPLQRMSPARSADDWKHAAGTFVVLPLSVSHVALRTGEDLRWESPATQCSVQQAPDRLLLKRLTEGMLVVTNQRIQFVNSLDDRPTQVWQEPLKSMQSAEIVPVGKSVVIVMRFQYPTPTIGYEVGLNTWKLKVDSQLLSIEMKPYDLLKLLQSLS